MKLYAFPSEIIVVLLRILKSIILMFMDYKMNLAYFKISHPIKFN